MSFRQASLEAHLSDYRSFSASGNKPSCFLARLPLAIGTPKGLEIHTFSHLLHFLEIVNKQLYNLNLNQFGLQIDDRALAQIVELCPNLEGLNDFQSLMFINKYPIKFILNFIKTYSKLYNTEIIC
ncbi:Conserved hypothetical protein [Candidatus Protochlamydia naegleriophila]|uniref:Uncharacterized protein n=1 Tax=Candidatus Protochlamydia naegleriophila TaxID=389348 RepID=A0A0U5JDF4_9BACT|nr:hypothetical protein [Candidatus Protochlamydia naegleriophila]CUI16804.1 Conserved hypothetical protein [Candidatus Protochlamydia naegleriophila]